jgi:hypothetical protein
VTAGDRRAWFPSRVSALECCLGLPSYLSVDEDDFLWQWPNSRAFIHRANPDVGLANIVVVCSGPSRSLPALQAPTIFNGRRLNGLSSFVDAYF